MKLRFIVPLSLILTAQLSPAWSSGLEEEVDEGPLNVGCSAGPISDSDERRIWEHTDQVLDEFMHAIHIKKQREKGKPFMEKLGLHPTRPDVRKAALSWLSYYYQLEGDSNTADRYMNLAYPGQRGIACEARACMYFTVEDYPNARKFSEEALRNTLTNPIVVCSVNRMLGVCYFKAGEHAKAKPKLQEALRIWPDGNDFLSDDGRRQVETYLRISHKKLVQEQNKKP